MEQDETNVHIVEVNLGNLNSTCTALGVAQETLPNFFVPIRLTSKQSSIDAVKKILAAMDTIASKHIQVLQYVLQLEKVLCDINSVVPNFNDMIMKKTLHVTKKQLIKNSETASTSQAQCLNEEYLSNLIIH